MGQSSKHNKTTSSDMDCPDSPLALTQGWCISQLDAMPEGSVITLTVEQYREMLLDQFRAQDLIQTLSKMLEEHVSND